MANSTTNLDLISSSQAQKEITANALFDASSPASLYGRRASGSANLTWAYYGGNLVINDIVTQIANGTLTLTPSTTNYIEMSNDTGLISINTVGFSPNATALYSVVTNSANASSYTDFRTFLTKNASTGRGSLIKNINNKGNGILDIVTSSILALGQNPVYVEIHPTSNWLYTVGSGNSINTLSINQDTGVLTSVGSVGTGTTPLGIAIEPTGRYLMVANSGSNTIQRYSINQTTGALTSLGTTSTGASTGPRDLCFDPSGRFLYCVNGTSGTVAQYSINLSSGALTSLGTAIAAGTGSRSVDCDPTGRFVYVSNNTANTISQYRIQTSGALASLGANVSSGGSSGPTNIKVNQDGTALYICNTTGNTIGKMNINTTTGVLSATTNLATGADPTDLIIDNKNYYLYVTNNTANTISQYSINYDYTLTLVQTIAYTGAKGLTQDPLGRFIFTIDSTSAIAITQTNFSTGALVASGKISANKGLDVSNGLLNLPKFTTAEAPAYVIGGAYFDTTLNKLRIGGATSWETVTSV